MGIIDLYEEILVVKSINVLIFPTNSKCLFDKQGVSVKNLITELYNIFWKRWTSESVTGEYVYECPQLNIDLTSGFAESARPNSRFATVALHI